MRLLELDTTIFKALNGLHSTSLDEVFWLFSAKLFWVPLYLLLAYVLYQRFRNHFFYLVMGMVVTIFFSDQITVLIKNSVMRLRPSHEPSLQGIVHIVHNYKGALYGFISSHAANSFATLSFIWAFTRRQQWLRYVLIVYALLTSYSRIYLGVHYPLDVLGGMAIGWMVGFMGSRLAWFLLSKNVFNIKS
jgi:undecaprenyl-diphosphatase